MPSRTPPLGILEDAAFWADQREIVLAVMEPMFVEMFILGAVAADEELRLSTKDDLPVPPGFPVDVIEQAARQEMATYSGDWWARWSGGVQAQLRETLLDAADSGVTPRALAGLLTDQFGPERAHTIAVTEMTNVMGAGAQARYRAAGFGLWRWNTSMDAAVCELCDAREAGSPYPMTESFKAEHPNCRCWPVPEGESNPPELF